MTFCFLICDWPWLLDVDAKEFLVEDEFAKGWVAFQHLLESGGFAGEVALALVLFVQELTSQVVDKLWQ